MNIRVGLENNIEGRTLAWVFDHPGCFAVAENSDAVLEALPDAIHTYASWIAAHEQNSWVEPNDIRINVEETWQVYTIDEDFELAPENKENYDVNAWFRHDWKPLTRQDIDRGLKLLTWSRQDFLHLIQDLEPKVLDFQPTGERWSIKGIIRHVGVAEWWYQDRLNPTIPYEALPKDPFEVIFKARESLQAMLPGLENKSLVTGASGEFWSPRKLLRRALWHERDHTHHIQKLLLMRENQ